MRCNKKRGACGVVVNALLLAGANAAGGVILPQVSGGAKKERDKNKIKV